MILINRLADVPNDENDVIGVILPAPDALVVGIIRLDVRLGGHAQKFVIPRVPSAQLRQRLHLSEDGALVSAGISDDDGILEGHVGRYLRWAERFGEGAFPRRLVVVGQLPRIVKQLPIGRQLPRLPVGFQWSVDLMGTLERTLFQDAKGPAVLGPLGRCALEEASDGAGAALEERAADGRGGRVDVAVGWRSQQRMTTPRVRRGSAWVTISRLLPLVEPVLAIIVYFWRSKIRRIKCKICRLSYPSKVVGFAYRQQPFVRPWRGDGLSPWETGSRTSRVSNCWSLQSLQGGHSASPKILFQY